MRIGTILPSNAANRYISIRSCASVSSGPLFRFCFSWRANCNSLSARDISTLHSAGNGPLGTRRGTDTKPAVPRPHCDHISFSSLSPFSILNSTSGTQGRTRQTRQDGRLRLAGSSHRFRDRVKWAHWTRLLESLDSSTGKAASRLPSPRLPAHSMAAWSPPLTSCARYLRSWAAHRPPHA